MDIDTIEKELGALQLSDSFFPTGAYAASNGLEFLFKERKISGPDDLSQIIGTNIAQQIGPTDCVAVAHVFESIAKNDFDGVLDADGTIFATKPVREVREAQTRSGIQLIKCVSGFVDNKMVNEYKISITESRAHGVFPVAFAVCCSALGISKERCMSMLLYGFTVSSVGAALRLGLIEHFEGQKIIHDTKPAISRAVSENSDRSLADMWQFAPHMDIVQMSHEKMDAKMFIT